MADEKPTIHIDADWKRQAQDEKKKLAEQEQKQPVAAAAAPDGPPGTMPGPRGGASARGRREAPPPGFPALVQSLVTQVLFYLGDLHQSGADPSVNLDMAKYQIDTLGVLEEKTANNLTPEERQMLDAALYEVRMRYVQVAAQYV